MSYQGIPHFTESSDAYALLTSSPQGIVVHQESLDRFFSQSEVKALTSSDIDRLVDGMSPQGFPMQDVDLPGVIIQETQVDTSHVIELVGKNLAQQKPQDAEVAKAGKEHNGQDAVNVESDADIVDTYADANSNDPLAPTVLASNFDYGEIKQFRQEDAVKNIQTFLLARGHEHVGSVDQKPDGMFGLKTAAALEIEIKKIQEQAGVEQTGEYNEATREALAASVEAAGDSVSFLSVLLQGLDAMAENMVDGAPALDRVYHPELPDSAVPRLDDKDSNAHMLADNTIGTPVGTFKP